MDKKILNLINQLVKFNPHETRIVFHAGFDLAAEFCVGDSVFLGIVSIIEGKC